MAGFQIQLGLFNVALAEVVVNVNHATIYSLHDHHLHIRFYLLFSGASCKNKKN